MGFLRKIGRKIKKRVKKLFSTKFGALIGGIGLSLILGPAISQAFNGIKGFFTQGATGATTAGATGATTAGATNVAVVDSTVSGAVEKLVNTPDLVVDSSNVDLIPVDNVVDTPIKYNYDKKGKLIGSEFGEVGKDAFVSSKGNILSSLKESEFIPNVAEGLTTSLAISAVQGEPEEPFISGGVASQPLTEPTQNAYLAEVGNQIPDYQGVNFQDLSNSMLFGTLSPQFLIGQAQSYS